MFWLRITKYNPIYRNEEGHYKKDEWTSYSDIGTRYDDKLITFQDYIKFEDAYVYAVISFMHCIEISELKIVNLEKYSDDFDKNYSQQMIKTLNSIKNNQVMTTNIEDVIRLVLRENMWCKLEGMGLAIHFGYDYYMYIGSEKKCDQQIKEIEKRGLFVEPYESPYLD